MENSELLREIYQKLVSIETKLDILTERMTECEDSCKNMDNHINFVENVYDTVRHPLNYITKSFNSIYSSSNSYVDLPKIEGK